MWRCYRCGMSGQAILLVGNDTFRLAERVKAVIDGQLPAESRLTGLETVDGRVESNGAAQVVSATLQALRSVSLFGGNRVVWLKDAEFLAAKGPERGAEEEGDRDAAKPAAVRDVLAELASCVKSGMPDGLTFLLTASSVDKRSVLYRAFDAAGRVEAVEISEKTWEAAKQARAFMDGQIAKRGLRMSEDARQVLLERVGADTQALATEVEKLSLYAGDRMIGTDDVVAIAAPSREAIFWELTDAIGDRDVAGAFAVLRQLLFQGESPMAVIALLEGYFRQLAVARDVLDKGWATVAGRELVWRDLGESEDAVLKALGKMDLKRMNPYRAFKLAHQASRRTGDGIRRCRQAALRAHERLVSSSLPQTLTLDFLLRQLLA